jgi:hypothetical protein
MKLTVAIWEADDLARCDLHRNLEMITQRTMA